MTEGSEVDQDCDLRYLRLAYKIAAEQSTDPSTQNGAVLVGLPCSEWNYEVNGNFQLDHVRRKPVREFICSANFFPHGVKESEERWTRPLKYRFVEHAERNVIFLAAKCGFKTEGATMYCAWAACADCARAIIQAGISELVTHHDPYADERFGQPVSETWKESIAVALGMLEEAGVKVRWIGDKLFPQNELEIKFNGISVSP